MKVGTIKTWKASKGFGFIEPADKGKDLFVHIKAFPKGTPTPVIGMKVRYSESQDADGRPRANQARLKNVSASLSPTSKALAIACGFLAVVAGIVWAGLLPIHFLWLYVGLSLLTYIIYATDKSAARQGSQRTAENTLHLLSLLGGWPGAMCAQQHLRHKSSKQSFRVVFWLTVVLNLIGLGYLTSGYGSWLAIYLTTQLDTF